MSNSVYIGQVALKKSGRQGPNLTKTDFFSIFLKNVCSQGIDTAVDSVTNDLVAARQKTEVTESY